MAFVVAVTCCGGWQCQIIYLILDNKRDYYYAAVKFLPFKFIFAGGKFLPTTLKFFTNFSYQTIKSDTQLGISLTNLQKLPKIYVFLPALT